MNKRDFKVHLNAAKRAAAVLARAGNSESEEFALTVKELDAVLERHGLPTQEGAGVVSMSSTNRPRFGTTPPPADISPALAAHLKKNRAEAVEAPPTTPPADEGEDDSVAPSAPAEADDKSDEGSDPEGTPKATEGDEGEVIAAAVNAGQVTVTDASGDLLTEITGSNVAALVGKYSSKELDGLIESLDGTVKTGKTKEQKAGYIRQLAADKLKG